MAKCSHKMSKYRWNNDVGYPEEEVERPLPMICFLSLLRVGVSSAFGSLIMGVQSQFGKGDATGFDHT